MKRPSGSSRRQGAHSAPPRSARRAFPRTRDENEDEEDWFLAPMCVRKLEVEAAHEPPPSCSSRRKEAHSIPTRPPAKRSEPRYLGCYVRLGGFKAPMRVQKLEGWVTRRSGPSRIDALRSGRP